MNDYLLAEVYRIVSSLVEFGEIDAVSEGGERATVKLSSGVTTRFLPFIWRRSGGESGKVRDSWPMEKGDKVVCLMPRGNIEHGVILGAIPRASDAAGKGRVITFGDGSTVSYDEKTRALSIDLAGEATATINVKSAKINADTIELGRGALFGNIVTTRSVCAFTGAPHPAGSPSCKVYEGGT